MSMKIYNGFKLKGVRSLDKAFFLMRDIRKPIQEAAELLAAKMLATRACFIYDEATVTGTELGMSALMKTRREIDDSLRESSIDRRRCYYDLGFDMALAVTTDKKVIGMVFCESNDLKDKFFALDTVIKYRYWDNSDKPDYASELEWTKRRGHWNEVLSDSAVPAQNMFTMQFLPEYQFPYPDKEDVAKQIITFDHRLQKLAERITISKASEELNLQSPSAIMQFIMQKSEFTPRLEAETEALREKIKPTLTIEDLQEKI